MLLQTIPLLICLVGLLLYTLLAGADFGAGLWQLLAGRGARARELRDHAHHSMAPVWEANHVWLVLVLTVLWTAYPRVFGTICTVLAVPIFLAAIGIVMRGLCYAMQSATERPRERRLIDLGFALSSIVTPFMLGTTLGSIASGRVLPGATSAGGPSVWLNPTSLVSGALAVTVGAYLAAVFLAADGRRHSGAPVIEAFRTRALLAGALAGVLSVLGLFVLAHDAARILHGLGTGWGLVCVLASAAGGIASLTLVGLRRFEPARVAAGVAVAGLLGGWAAAQRPFVLPGVTLSDAAAGTATLLALTISVVLGAVILTPSLAVLFRLSLAGHLDPAPPARTVHRLGGPDATRPRWAGRAGLACFVVGLVLLTVADSGVAHAFGVLALAAAGLGVFTAVGPDQLAGPEPEPSSPTHGRGGPADPR